MTTKIQIRKSGDVVIPARVLKSWGLAPGMEVEIDIRVPSDGGHAKFPPDIPPDKTVQDFLDEYEQKYHLSSDEFYELWLNGQSEDTPEMNDWALFCSLKLTLEEKGEDPSKATFKPFRPEEKYAQPEAEC
jgi:antitoxin component of MazEF toxin-antitoxin module